MAKRTIASRKNALLDRLHALTIEYLSPHTKRISSKSGAENNEPGNIEITDQYNIEEFGFAPGDFVFTDCETIALCVGVNVDPEKCRPRKQNLWFLDEGENGITYWPNARKKNFIANGFTLVQEKELIN